MNQNDIASTLKNGKAFLKEKNIESFSSDSLVLLEKSLNKNKVEILTKGEEQISNAELELYKSYLNERSKRKPIAYITKSKEFMSLDFFINENVLIPRPDTEVLTEKIIELLKANPKKNKILELCTGSGCISVATTKFCPHARIIAVDISKKALEVAKINATKNNVADKITYIEANVFEILNNIDSFEQNFDYIISNPPYIAEDEIKLLQDDIKKYEPIVALNGGKDGLDFYRTIAYLSTYLLKHDSMLLFEVGNKQSNHVKEILEENNFKEINIIKDLSGFDRTLTARFI